jgi:hypothetical protein
MANTLRLKGSRKYPNVPVITDDPAVHTAALVALKESMEIGQRRTPDLFNSFIRVQDLLDLGLIDLKGNAQSVVGADLSQIANIGDLTGSAAGDFLRYDGTNWVNDQLSTSDITQVMVTQHQAALVIDWSQLTSIPALVLQTRTLTAGAGLTGGGSLAADRTFDVGAGTGITVNANDVALSAASIASLLLADSSVQPARTLTAGAGLTGGGSLAADRTFDVGAGTGITVNANDIAIDQTFAPTWTGKHVFAGASANVTTTGVLPGLRVGLPQLVWVTASAAVDARAWEAIGSDTSFGLRAINDTFTAARNVFGATRSGLGVTVVSLGNATDNTAIRLLGDNQELQLGVSQDLRLYHDGTDSWINNDTGDLVIDTPGNLRLTGNAILRHVFAGQMKWQLQNTSAPTGDRTWEIRLANTGVLGVVADDDSFNGLLGALTIQPFSLGSHVAFPNDSQELRLGASSDLRIFHDGTNSLIRNDTGILQISLSGTVGAAFNQGTGNYKFQVFSAGALGLQFQTVGSTFGNPAMNFSDSTHSVDAIITPLAAGLAIGCFSNHNLHFYKNNARVMAINGATTTGAQTATFTATNKPGSGTAGPISWLPVFLADGSTQGYIPIFGA